MITISKHEICRKWCYLLRCAFGTPGNCVGVWQIKPIQKNLRKLKAVLRAVPKYKNLTYTDVLALVSTFACSASYREIELTDFISRNHHRRISESECLHRLKRHYT